MHFSPLVLQHAPWSISKADAAAQCGLRFHWKYIEKIKEPAIIRPESRVGSAAHKAVELMLKGHDLRRAFTVGAVENKLATKEIEDLMTFQGTIQEFLKRIERFKETHPVKDQVIEHQFGLTIDLNPTKFFGNDVFFRGAWDLGLRLESEDLVIIDHKSGPPSEDLTKYTNQLNFYALAGRRLFPQIKWAQSAIHYLRDGSLVWGTYISTADIDAKLSDWLVEYLNRSVEGLEKVPRAGWFCDFCGYASKCPLKGKTK